MKLAEALLSFTQGASNSIASNLSAPVDGIAWALRKAGMQIPENQVGGSDWMSQKGLTAEPKNRLSGLLGETAGMAGPLLLAKKAPQIANGILTMQENAMVPATLNKQAGVVLGDLNRSGRFTGKPIANAPSSFDTYTNPNLLKEDMVKYADRPTLNNRLSTLINEKISNEKSLEEMKAAYEKIYGPMSSNSLIDLIYSKIRPQTFKASQEANNAGVEYSKAFTNSGKYLGPIK
jgi:hypothetical protein